MATTVSRVPSRELLRILRHSFLTGNTATPTRIPRSCRLVDPIQSHTTFLPTARCISSTGQRSAEPSTARRPTSQQYQHEGGQSPSPSIARRNPYAPTTRDRGPESKEDTQTDFGAMDIYSNTPEPATSIDACTPGGFHLNNGAKITGGSGVLLVGGEAFSWKPWIATTTNNINDNSDDNKVENNENRGDDEPRISNLLDSKGLLVIPSKSLSLLQFLHPKPDLLLIGTGSKTLMLHPASRSYIVDELGMRIDVMDTANASAAYNLLAKERGVEGGSGVGGAMLPVGWKGVDVKKKNISNNNNNSSSSSRRRKKVVN